MRGAYKSGQRRVLVGSGYKIAIGVVIAMTVALIMVLLAFLPATEDTITVERRIVSIENESGDIGVNVNPSSIFVKVTYSDGTSESVPLSGTVYEGLDLSVAGSNNVALSYGGFEQTVAFNVKNVDCVVRYEGSVGGSIQGEQVQYVPNGGSADTVIAVPETGYVFVKWNDGYPLAARKDTGVTESKTFAAIFEKAKYTVRFYYYNGTVASEEKVQFGSGATKAPVYGADRGMERYGYTFVSWVPSDFTSVDRDMVIRPEYVKTATDVILTVPTDIYGNEMGTTDLREEGYYAHGQLATIVATPYNSRVFSRWVITGTDGVEYEIKRDGAGSTKSIPVGIAGQTVTFTSTKSGNTAEDYQLSFTPTADVSQIKVKAIFAYSELDVTFVNYQKSDNNSVECVVTGVRSDRPLSYVTDTLYPETDGLPKPADVNGMEFVGWYKAGDVTQTIVDKTVSFEQPTTLVAKWKRKQYSLRFIFRDPSGTNDTLWHETVATYQNSFASGSNGGLPETNPTADNYVFVGWIDALTGATVDDKTKLLYDGAYDRNDDFANGIVRFIPVWEPIRHRLYVSLKGGAGKARLVIDPGKIDSDGNLLETTEEVNGETVIYENRKYKLKVLADEGYELVSSVWGYNGILTSPKSYLPGTDNAEFDLFVASDNVITVDLQIKKIEISVTNGDGYYAGLIEFNGATYQDGTETFTVDYNSGATMKIVSNNSVYSIKDVLVDGTSVGYAFGDGTLEYTLVLPGLKKSCSVEIKYNTRRYNVWADKTDGGVICLADLFDLNKESLFGGASLQEYAYGEKMYLRIKADGNGGVRKVISSVRINGVVCDLYSPSVDGARFANWYINAEEYGVKIQLINGYYYYVYGEVTYGSDEYVYCESVTDASSAVFRKRIAGEETVYVTVSKADNASLYSSIYSDLKVSEKKVTDTTLRRDTRITSIDLLIDVTKNFNISATFRPIEYTVSAESYGDGSAEVSSSTVSFNGSSRITAKPAAGYYVSGYTVNGGAFTVAETGKKGEDFSLELNGIAEDKTIAFFFEEIKYKVTFENASAAIGDVYVDGELLNNSVSLEYAYHSSVKVTIGLNDADVAHRISRIVVVKNGVEREETVHFNMTEYVLTESDVTANLSVKIYLADKTADATENYYTVDIAGSVLIESTVSAEFTSAKFDESNEILVKADYGYRIKDITVRTQSSDKVLPASVTSAAAGRKGYSFSIPAGTFAAGDIVVISVNTTPESYSLTTSYEGEGSVSGGKEFVYFGSEELIDVAANQYCYVKTVYINGEEISFRSSYWSSLITDGSTGRYVSGTLSYMPERDMDVKVVFARNTYKMTVDASSVNGSTTLSVTKNDESGDGATEVSGITDGSKSEYVPHGWFVTVNMSADTGYHVSALYINDVKAELQFATSDENAHKSATYVYKGELIENKRVGATGRINVKVEYEINKYGFTYAINNVSKNFSSDAFCGTVSSSFIADGNRYYGIEHGGNFAFTVTPSVANGYYLKQIRMLYKSAYDSSVKEIIHVPGDAALSDVTISGGTVWFNRFTETSDGLTADIELIEVTFDRNLYKVDLAQSSAAYTGKMDIVFSHGNADVYYIAIPDADGNKYYYRNGTFFTYDGANYVDTGIKLVNKAGNYVYTDGSKDYTMLIEHGLRYSVYVTPEIGYERVAFTLNGEDAHSRVNDNRYSTNVDRNLTIATRFRVLTYDVNFGITVHDKDRTGKISATEIRDYAEIYVRVISGDIYYLDYNPVTGHDEWFGLEYGKEGVTISAADGVGYKLGYGARIQFIMVPKFDAKGYELSSFVLEDTDITDRVKAIKTTLPSSAGQVEVLCYGGADMNEGYLVVSDLEARSVFDITRYNIHTEVVYADGVVGETINYLREESGLTIAWGDYGEVRVNIGDGFILKNIRVNRGGVENDVNLIDSADNDAYDEQMYYNKRNVNTNEYRDVLRVRKVKTDVYLTATVERKEYEVRFKINDKSKLYEINTVFNEHHAGYPVSSDSSNGSAGMWEENAGAASYYVIKAWHYDELTVTVSPKNGYSVLPISDGVKADYKAVVRAIRYNEDTKEWEYMRDNAGNLIYTELNFGTLDGDIRQFTFHSATSPVAATYIASSVEIEINIAVKTYETSTSIGYIDAVGKDNKNNTTVVWNIFDGKNDANPSSTAGLTVNNSSLSGVVNHHGKIRYEFTAQEGYRLNGITINGVSYRNLETTGKYYFDSEGERVTFSSENYEYTVVRRLDEERKWVYYYSISFNIDDALIKGAYNVPQTAIEVYIEIAPIKYEIKTYINGVYYENALHGTMNGSSDGKTVTVYSPATVEHFNTFAVSPTLFVGYTVESLAVKTGRTDDNAADLDATEYSVNAPNSNKNYSASYTFMPNVNLLNGRQTVHLFYATKIVSYKVKADAYAYSKNDGVIKKDELGQITENSAGYIDYDTAIGKVSAYVTTGGVRKELVNGASYEYFSEVMIEAYANDGYVMYEIAEVSNGAEVAVRNGVDGITYYSEESGGKTKYVIRYTVDSYGDRRFKIIFKQKTTVTVNVLNPYKYTQGSAIGAIDYYSYVSLTAKQNGVLVRNGNDDGKVCDKYVYEVLVGNYVALIYKDLYVRSGQSSYEFCTYSAETDKYTPVALSVNPAYPDGLGKIIDGETELYLINNVYSRITFEKDTLGATEGASGGTVYFNGSGTEPSDGKLYTSATTINSVVTITVRPNENYVFSNLYVRQRDVAKSRAEGRIVYKEGSDEWLIYDDGFASKDSNGFIISSRKDVSGNTIYTVKMRGDMELKFEFYRVYEVVFGANYSDKGTTYGDVNSADSIVKLSDVSYNDYGEAYSQESANAGKYFVQYGSSFTLTAPAAPENYVFVGWYLNDSNTYVYLDRLLPTTDYLKRQFIINSDLEGLIADGYEAAGLNFVAMYQPVINVAVINETFYYDNSHWNSWQSGFLRTEYYDFDGAKISDTVKNGIVRNASSAALSDLTYEDLAVKAGGDNGWNLAANSGASGDKQVYSAMSLFKVLYQSITNYDLVGNNWTDGYVTFKMESLPSSVKHLGWQYYNWNTRAYADIEYRYEDKNYGIDPNTGSYTIVDNTFEEYVFKLGYLFSGEMPYAVSAGDENNRDFSRPLIVRPNLHKVVGLELTQKAYIKELGDEMNSDSDFAGVIHPTISSVTGSGVYYAIDDKTMNGEFDYGAVANIRHYDRTGENGIINYPLEESNDITTRYRFIGWRMYWEVNGIKAYRFIHLAEGDEAAGLDVELTYMFNDSPPSSDTIQIEALYILQSRQSVYSYNVAGSDYSYQDALARGHYAVNDSPDLSVKLESSAQDFETYDVATGTKGVCTLAYQSENLTSEAGSRALQYLMDVGSKYTVSLKTDERKADVTKFVENTAGSNTNTNTQGYDPNVDKFHAVYFNKNTAYETKGEELTYTGGTYTVAGTYSIDVQYKSHAKLVFNNVMYGSGVTLPDSILNYLGLDVEKLTVWDTDATYGDSATSDNGVIEFNVDLINLGGANLHGVFNYSLKGFTSGNGFKAMKKLAYKYRVSATDSVERGNDSNLFNPTHESYRRYIVIDYNDGYISGGSLIFGNPAITGNNKYNVTNTGDGTAANPYRIYNATQLMNVSLFFYANENSCNTKEKDANGAITEIQTVFKLFDNVKLQDYTNSSTASAFPGGISEAWVPLCFSLDDGYDKGFDGIFDGGGYTLSNLAAYAGGSPDQDNPQDENLVPAEATYRNPLAAFDYDGLQGYGIFGCVYGGTIKNLKIDDSFISFTEERFASVGLLAAKAYNATFENVSFPETKNPTRTNLIESSNGGARIYMSTWAQNMGMLVGYAKNCQIKNIDVSVGNSSNIYLLSELGSDGGNAGVGLLVGYIEGSTDLAGVGGRTSFINGVNVTGTSSKYVIINDYSNRSMPTGGIIGSAKRGTYVSSITMTSLNMQIGGEDSGTTGYAGGVAGYCSDSYFEIIEIRSANNYARTDEKKGVIIHGSQATGGAIGYANNSEISFVTLYGLFRMRGTSAGGVAGVNTGLIRDCYITAPKTSTDDGMRLMFDQSNGHNASISDFGGIVGLNEGTVTDCGITGGNGAAAYDADYKNINGAAVYVYHSGNTNHNAIDTVDQNVNESEIKNSAKNVVGRVSVGGIVGRATGRVYNSYVAYTRTTVRLDVNAGNPARYNGSDGLPLAHCLVISAGGIAGTLEGGSLVNGELADGSDFGFYDELNRFDSNLDSKPEYKTRVQSCFTSNASVVVANRVWVDSYDVEKEATLMASNSVTVAGIVGSVKNYVGEYGINSCYSLNNHFSTQMGAYGWITNDGEEGDNKSTKYGWYYASTAMFGGKKKYTPIRTGLKMDGGIYGIVGGEYIDDEHKDSGNHGCNYCWSKGNTIETRNAVNSLSDMGARDNPLKTRGMDLQIGENYRSFTSDHSEGNVACPNMPYGVSMDEMRVTGMEAYGLNEFVIGTDTVNVREVNVLFGAGFVGVYDSSKKGGSDGRLFKTDYKTGVLLVSHEVNKTAAETKWSRYAASSGTYDSGTTVGGMTYQQFIASYNNYKDYLVKGQGDSAIPN